MTLRFVERAYECCYGEPGQLMVIAALCEGEEMSVQGRATVDDRRRAIGIRRAAADRRVLASVVVECLARRKWSLFEDLADEPVVIFSRSNGPYGTAFSPVMDGRPLTFHLRDGFIRDNETGSRWDLAGRAVAGPLAGQALSPLPVRRAFWFSIALAMPDIPLYEP